MKKGISAESTLIVFIVIFIISVAGLSFIVHQGGSPKENTSKTLKPEETNVEITDFLVNNNNCDKGNCEIQSGESANLSLSFQCDKLVNNLKLRVWGVEGEFSGDYQIDSSRTVDMTEAGTWTENFKISYCSSCAGIDPDYYNMHAEISKDNKVFDNYTTEIYLYEND